MFKKFILFGVYFTILVGCSSRPDVHLYARYMDKQQEEIISSKIEEAGFNIKLNSLRFPTEISDSTIIYSPLILDSSNVDILVETIKSLGIEVNSVIPFVSGNHWYKKNSLAVFIVPNDGSLDDTVMREDLTNIWSANECEIAIVLTLNEDGKYKLTGDKLEGFDPLLTSGTWLYRQFPYIELRPHKGESWYSYYEISRYQEEDQISKIDMLNLKPLESHQIAGDCNFEFGSRYF